MTLYNHHYTLAVVTTGGLVIINWLLELISGWWCCRCSLSSLFNQLITLQRILPIMLSSHMYHTQIYRITCSCMQQVHHKHTVHTHTHIHTHTLHYTHRASKRSGRTSIMMAWAHEWGLCHTHTKHSISAHTMTQTHHSHWFSALLDTSPVPV